jgi:glyoxylase-like metal-dependent hydrolase (beta-lactamase superfamily II)
MIFRQLLRAPVEHLHLPHRLRADAPGAADRPGGQQHRARPGRSPATRPDPGVHARHPHPRRPHHRRTAAQAARQQPHRSAGHGPPALHRHRRRRRHTPATGQHHAEPLHTPGHTDGHFAYVGAGRVFTGDALLIDGCGRTDFQNGSATDLYRSVTEKLFSLPDEHLVYPGHDYHGRRVSSIGQEKARNPAWASSARWPTSSRSWPA